MIVIISLSLLRSHILKKQRNKYEFPNLPQYFPKLKESNIFFYKNCLLTGPLIPTIIRFFILYYNIYYIYYKISLRMLTHLKDI